MAGERYFIFISLFVTFASVVYGVECASDCTWGTCSFCWAGGCEDTLSISWKGVSSGSATLYDGDCMDYNYEITFLVNDCSECGLEGCSCSCSTGSYTGAYCTCTCDDIDGPSDCYYSCSPHYVYGTAACGAGHFWSSDDVIVSELFSYCDGISKPRSVKLGTGVTAIKWTDKSFWLGDPYFHLCYVDSGTWKMNCYNSVSVDKDEWFNINPKEGYIYVAFLTDASQGELYVIGFNCCDSTIRSTFSSWCSSVSCCESYETDCSDGKDNDCDGYTDCADVDCCYSCKGKEIPPSDQNLLTSSGVTYVRCTSDSDCSSTCSPGATCTCAYADDLVDDLGSLYITGWVDYDGVQVSSNCGICQSQGCLQCGTYSVCDCNELYFKCDLNPGLSCYRSYKDSCGGIADCKLIQLDVGYCENGKYNKTIDLHDYINFSSCGIYSCEYNSKCSVSASDISKFVSWEVDNGEKNGKYAIIPAGTLDCYSDYTLTVRMSVQNITSGYCSGTQLNCGDCCSGNNREKCYTAVFEIQWTTGGGPSEGGAGGSGSGGEGGGGSVSEVCTNGIDDDGDGLVDCADTTDCCSDPACECDSNCYTFNGGVSLDCPSSVPLDQSTVIIPVSSSGGSLSDLTCDSTQGTATESGSSCEINLTDACPGPVQVTATAEITDDCGTHSVSDSCVFNIRSLVPHIRVTQSNPSPDCGDDVTLELECYDDFGTITPTRSKYPTNVSWNLIGFKDWGTCASGANPCTATVHTSLLSPYTSVKIYCSVDDYGETDECPSGYWNPNEVGVTHTISCRGSQCFTDAAVSSNNPPICGEDVSYTISCVRNYGSGVWEPADVKDIDVTGFDTTTCGGSLNPCEGTKHVTGPFQVTVECDFADSSCPDVTKTFNLSCSNIVEDKIKLVDFSCENITCINKYAITKMYPCLNGVYSPVSSVSCPAISENISSLKCYLTVLNNFGEKKSVSIQLTLNNKSVVKNVNLPAEPCLSSHTLIVPVEASVGQIISGSIIIKDKSTGDIYHYVLIVSSRENMTQVIPTPVTALPEYPSHTLIYGILILLLWVMFNNKVERG